MPFDTELNCKFTTLILWHLCVSRGGQNGQRCNRLAPLWSGLPKTAASAGQKILDREKKYVLQFNFLYRMA